MKKRTLAAALPLCLSLLLSGCGAIGSKSTSLSVIYGATAVLALLMLVGYCVTVHRREVWFLLLFSSILIVNVGYLALSVSKTLEEALLANRISYFGSVFLPMSMLMILLRTTKLRFRKQLPLALLIVGLLVFAIAASPGYLDIYYKTVSLGHSSGVTVLIKEYGSWHWIYLAYLVLYFGSMVAVILHASARRAMDSSIQSVMLAGAVFVNIGVWLLEQLVRIDFEFLSVSYIISELFLLGLCLMVQEREKELSSVPLPAPAAEESPLPPAEPLPVAPEQEPDPLTDQILRFTTGLRDLTHTERMIYGFYLEGRTTKEIMTELDIKENTLKYHNKNLYSKLDVSSRKQLVEIARSLHLDAPGEETAI